MKKRISMPDNLYKPISRRGLKKRNKRYIESSPEDSEAKRNKRLKEISRVPPDQYALSNMADIYNYELETGNVVDMR